MMTYDYRSFGRSNRRYGQKDSRLNIDNNRTERAVKHFVIGRKNWLFNHNHHGAEASAILYSIIETAKANGLTHHQDGHDICHQQHLAPNAISLK